MHHFTEKNGHLFAEDIAIATIAEEVGTPFYCYSAATLRHHYRILADALGGLDATICYSAKANANLGVLKVLADEGAGVDIVSEGELHRALAAGIAAEKIVFSGIGKTAQEMTAALRAGIILFNVESRAELVLLSAIAAQEKQTARIALRVNPDIDAGTHEKIATGKAETKFGIAWEEVPETFAQAAALPHITPCGIDIHIGSQITELSVFRQAFRKTRELLETLRKQGHHIDCLDLGGGLGVPYQSPDEPNRLPNPADYAALIAEQFGDAGCHIFIEPGRVIAGNAGLLITSVIRTKKSKAKNFIIVDAAMTELLRPALYGAYHHIAPVIAAEGTAQKPAMDAEQVWDIVGPVCETSDFLGLDRKLAEPQAGDLLAIFTAGAYGAVLGSNYNSRLTAAEVLVDGTEYAVTRARQTYDALLAPETIPHWLQNNQNKSQTKNKREK